MKHVSLQKIHSPLNFTLYALSVNNLITKRSFGSLDQSILSIFCFCPTNSFHKQGKPRQVGLRGQHGAAPVRPERPPGLPEVPGERGGEHVEAGQ